VAANITAPDIGALTASRFHLGSKPNPLNRLQKFSPAHVNRGLSPLGCAAPFLVSKTPI
jgi:hypothetical protein